MSRRIVGPFNRVEGDLEVQLDIADGEVRDAWVVSPLYRGFEQILHGKDPLDALVYAPRICGICSVSQSVAAAMALAQAQGIDMPENGQHATNLVLANENVADHLTHFYLFFMPDFARDIYRADSWHADAAARFKAVVGCAARDFLPSRAKFLHLMGLLAGKWPHSLALQPGGTTRAVEAQEKIRILALLFEFRRFLERTLYGMELEQLADIDTIEKLTACQEQAAVRDSDLGHFLRIAGQLDLASLGRTDNIFMSYGAYPVSGKRLFGRGLWSEAGWQALREDRIAEDMSHSWMAHRSTPLHPYEGITQPDASAEAGYSWCKAPRLDGRVVEVGALARQVVDGHPLARELVAAGGSNVRNRVIARLIETARIVMAMEAWARALRPGEPFCRQAEMPEEAQGAGLVEAARGSLGHWLRIKNGRILNYQIIAPTTWNFSPRDHHHVRGTLEQALLGAPVRHGEKDPVAVQHIVRSFDPCMVCTVH
jgi:Ni,Fe-hydrogenase I large subunit